MVYSRRSGKRALLHRNGRPAGSFIGRSQGRDQLLRKSARTIIELIGQRVFESELRRLYGELILAKDSTNAEEAERESHTAIYIAQRQRAKSLELRAAMSLARLWNAQGKSEQARAKPANCYGWFSEGFNTADLVGAKELLDQLQIRLANIS